MKVLVIGCGISGLTTAIELAAKSHHVDLISTYPSERAQSVMAAGGINSFSKKSRNGLEDSYEIHAQDTLKGGCYLEDEATILNFCKHAPDCLQFLSKLGTRFNRDSDGSISRRAFGGQSRKRTAFSGSSTGKQIVTSLTNKCREYEIKGFVTRHFNMRFHSAFINEGKCYGALFYNELTRDLRAFYADAVVMATGGQNVLFGKTTGSTLNDGYAVARLMTQGVKLRNLEFIQYHPTTITTDHKKMLITEAARGEGGRLFYLDENNNRIYFMEDKYGKNGNLMPRDIVSREIFNTHKQCYLDITFLGKNLIHNRLEEVYQLCKDYINLDVTREVIPISPSVHFFMGGIYVDDNHRTNIKNLYAVGECASKYHGANRLGGNSLLAAVYSGRVAAESLNKENIENETPDFTDIIKNETRIIEELKNTKSTFPSVYISNDLATIMNNNLGIVRDEESLKEGIRQVIFYEEQVSKIKQDPSISIYENYRLPFLLILAEAILKSALARKESRGAHYRSDYPCTNEEYKTNSIISMNANKEIEINYENVNR